MIDTILIYLDKNVDGVNSFCEKYKKNRNPKLLEHFHITIFPISIRIMGSLAKYIYGTNSYTPTFNEDKEALIEIGERLKVDIKEGIVRRIDIGHNFSMKKPIPLYILDIWSTPHTYTKVYDDYCVQLTNSCRTISFYDKKKETEMKKKIDYSGTTWEDKNILRYELQLKKRIKEEFNNETIYVKMLLSDNKIINSLLFQWFFTAKQVERMCQLSDNLHAWIPSKGMTPKQFFEQLASIGLKILTPKQKRVILNYAKNNRDNNSYYRILKKIKLLSENEIKSQRGQYLWPEFEKKLSAFYNKQCLALSSSSGTL